MRIIRFLSVPILVCSFAAAQASSQKPSEQPSPGANKPDAATKTGETPSRPQTPPRAQVKPPIAGPPTAAAADKFVADAEAKLFDLGIKAQRAGWVQENFITEDTDKIAADFSEQFTALGTQLAKDAVKFDKAQVSFDTRRKLQLLKLALTVPGPSNPKEREELATILVSMNGAYGRGKYCPQGEQTANGQQKCYTLNDAEKIMRESQNEAELRKAWIGWHSISPPYRKDYARFVELGNKGAREQGYKDLGALWRSNYDMPPDEFRAEMERLWLQVKPLYDSLHAYTRGKLREKYGNMVPEDGPIPAHLLGNMWSQEWTNIYPLLAPPNADPGYDLTKIFAEKKYDAKQLVKFGENFYTSLGMPDLPKTFYERSLFTKPQDRDVVCHASAWNINAVDDVRIKMCIEGTDEDFQTIHHELGHNYYTLAYNKQPPLYQGGANDGFHEAVGDTIALSITPEYLHQLGLVQTVPDSSKDLGLLMHRALQKVSFLPFGYLMDQWRWKVFNGEIKPEDYNKGWWQLRTQYQGIVPPEARGEQFFDAGAKYHIPGNTPYARYFLATIFQYQFHRGLCRIAGHQGPLHRCSIYKNPAAGQALWKMLSLGQSRPWPEALKAMTGEEKLDATAMLDYFSPLKKWLDEQNRGKKIGWTPGSKAE